MTPHEQWERSRECLEAAWDWFNNEHLLDAYLGTRQSDDDYRDYRDYLADTAVEGNAERRRLAAG